MFKNLGQLNYSTKEKELKISLNEIKSGINFFESFIIYQDNSSIKIYDRRCDHAGGKIISKEVIFCICTNQCRHFGSIYLWHRYHLNCAIFIFLNFIASCVTFDHVCKVKLLKICLWVKKMLQKWVS